MTMIKRTFDWLLANTEALLLGSLIAVVLVLIMLGFRWFGHRVIAKDPHCLTWKGVIGRVLAKTSLPFMILVAVDTVARYADMPPRPEHLLHVLVTIAVALQAAIWGRELILGVVHRNVGEEPGGSNLGSATAVIRVLVSVALFGLALVAILDNLGINVTALVAGLGVGGIAIGLAAQGIFSDLFAALAILFDKPFRRGDTIRYDATVGTVERIGLKTTRLRSPTGEQVIMANTKLLEREIHNLAAAQRRRQTLTFGLTYQTGSARLEQARTEAEKVIGRAQGCTLVRCAITGLGASSIDFELLWDDDDLDANVNASRRGAIIEDLISTFSAAKLDFAYPTQVTFTAAPDGTMIMPFATPANDRAPPQG